MNHAGRFGDRCSPNPGVSKVHMTKQNHNGRKLSFWQLIFLQSKANGASYHGDTLRRHNWEWPQETYLQRRLRYLKDSRLQPIHPPNLSTEERFERAYEKLMREHPSN